MSNWVPHAVVKLDGKEVVGEDFAHLQTITVDLRRQAPASVELQFNNHDGSFPSRPELGPGAKVLVSLGYQEQKQTTVYEGEIGGALVRVQENGPRLFVARAFDSLHRLTRSRRNETYLEQKFSDIVKTVAGRHGLSPKADATTFNREYVIQHNQTDLDFVRGIATWLDYELRIDHLKSATDLLFKKPALKTKSGIKLVYEKPDVEKGEIHIKRFDGRVSMARVVSKVVVRGWDPGTKKAIIGEMATSLYDKMGKKSATEVVKKAWGETIRQVVDYKVFSEQEAKAVAETKLNEYARTFVRADIEIQGHAKVAPGLVVEVSRVGEQMDGPYYVDAVRHIFTSPVGPGGGFLTRIEASRCGWGS